mmetsp:Transcript_58739/g.166970  ORF Transcript_58739/g.166970 Transcript_58739/m.166970 type:complete len:224 (-) Transcript_58739:64-735(-)
MANVLLKLAHVMLPGRQPGAAARARRLGPDRAALLLAQREGRRGPGRGRGRGRAQRCQQLLEREHVGIAVVNGVLLLKALQRRVGLGYLEASSRPARRLRRPADGQLLGRALFRPVGEGDGEEAQANVDLLQLLAARAAGALRVDLAQEPAVGAPLDVLHHALGLGAGAGGNVHGAVVGTGVAPRGAEVAGGALHLGLDLIGLAGQPVVVRGGWLGLQLQQQR